MNPLALRGPEFLGFWIVSGLIAGAITLLLRRWLLGPRGSASDVNAARARLHPTEIAYLVGGIERAVEAAVAGLLQDGVLRLEQARLRVTELASDGYHDRRRLAPVELHVVDQLSRSEAVSVASIIARAIRVDHELGAALRAQRLLSAARPRSLYLPAMAWLGLGATKLVLGILRERPVGLLVMVGLLGAYALRVRWPRLATLGRQVRDTIERDSLGLMATARRARAQLTGPEVTLAYAFAGVTVVDVALMSLLPSHHHVIAASYSGSSSSGSSCGSGGCSGGGCSGGGCSGGGCSGGGCGGCSS